MVTRIQSVHFDASQQLMEFVEKKVAKLEKICEGATSLEVVMKLVKPETVKFLLPRLVILLRMLSLVQSMPLRFK